MIVDIVMFNDEEFHLQCRIHELHQTVDRFVVIEGNRTMQGDPKPFHLEGKEGKYRRFGVDFVHADLEWLDDVPEQNYAWVKAGFEEDWKRDWKQRNAVTKIINEFPEDTVFLMGDVDEIPKKQIIREFDGEASVLMMRHLIYSVKWTTGEPWAGTVIGTKKQLKTFPRARNARWGYRQIHDAGWHLGWFGGEVAIQKKAREFAHGEMAPYAKEIAETYPRQHIRPSGGILEPYAGDLPTWVKDGHGPNSWYLDW